jgi:hypothetical protein
MRTDRLCFAGAAAIAVQVVVLSSTTGAPAAVFNFIAFAAITLLLWIATRGRRPGHVTGATAAAGFLVADPLAAVAAALVTGITLYFLQGKPACAASSRR